jgi:hypothetical protein
VFDFAHLENFPATGGFRERNIEKNEAVFREFFDPILEFSDFRFGGY